MTALHSKNLITMAIACAFSMSVSANDSPENHTKNNTETNIEKKTENNKKQEQAIEEISVVAQKIAYANHVIEPSMKEQQSPASSVLAVIDNLPGISINEGDAFGGDDWSTSITMRGFSVDGSQQQLGMTVDGIPNGGSNYGGGSKANRYLDSENMQTVEVSQGTADISSASLEALGGTFNFISDDPLFEETTKFAYTNGDQGASRYFVRHDTGRIFSNTHAYMSYSSTETDRWVGEGSNGGMQREHAELKFITELGRLTVTGRLSYDNADEDNYNSVTLEQFNQTPDWDQLTWNWTGVPHFDQMFAEGWSTLRENTLAYVKFEYRLDDSLSFQVTPYYHSNEGRGDWIPPYLILTDGSGNAVLDDDDNLISYGFTDASGEPLTANSSCTEDDELVWPWDSGTGLSPACFSTDATPVMSYRHTHYEKERLGITADATWLLGMNDIKAGIWAESTQRDESRDWHKVIDARVYHHFDETPYWVQYSNEFQTDTLKVYLQDTVSLGDFTVNVGVQKYLVDIEKVNAFDGEVTGNVNSDSDVLFSAGGVYQVNGNIDLFAGYSQNFSAIKDGVLERDASALEYIEPETANNIDVGARYNTGNLSLSATYYQIDFDNKITYIAPGNDGDGIDYDIGTNGSYINEGGVESTGFELSASYRLGKHWNLYSSYTNNDSTYAEDVPNSDIKAGDKVNDSVDDMFVFSSDYTKGAFRAGLSGKYTGERGVAPSYTTIDLNTGYSVAFNSQSIKSIDLAFVITNITDESYLSTGTGNGKSFFIGAPRTASMTFTASF